VIIYDINRAMLAAGMHKILGRPLEACIRHVQGDASGSPFPTAASTPPWWVSASAMSPACGRGLPRCTGCSGPAAAPVSRIFTAGLAGVPLAVRCVFVPHHAAGGELIAGSRKAYTHLPESIRMFPLPHELADMLQRVGFGRVDYRRFTNGIAVAHLAVK